MRPQLIGPYRIENILGRGGAGTVFRARDLRANEEVALKLLTVGPALDSIAARRMVREFEALAALSHPNVVRVFDAGVHKGHPYLVMELIEGLDLRSYLSIDHRESRPIALQAAASGPIARAVGGGMAENPAAIFGLDDLFDEPDTGNFALEHPGGRAALVEHADQAAEPDTEGMPPSGSSSGSIPWDLDGLPFFVEDDEPARAVEASGALVLELNRPERVARLKDAVVQICEALSYIHSHGMVHRDLKPGNILVDEDRRVRLMDFGLAKFLAEDGAMTATGRVVGTYRYMAPEQAMGEPVDGRADLYALGVLLYELLAGRPPYDGRTPLEMWQQLLDHEPASLFAINPRVDEELARLAHRLLRKEPDERYRTAEEIVELLLAG